MKKIALLVLFAIILIIYFLGGDQYLTVGQFQQAYEQQPVVAALIYFTLYVVVTGFSLPAASLLTVIAGMVFGLGVGTVLVSFASAIGATLAFTFSRFLLRNWVQERLGDYLRQVDQGVKKDGAFYLFSLRLIPVFPFWVINLVFGLTPLRTKTFYIISQLGMLPATLVYVNAGAQLGAVETFTLSGVMTPGLLTSFVLLGIFPFIVKALMSAWQQRKQYRPFKKPAHFDTNLIVIGAGSAGLVSAYIASTVKAKVTLIEKNKMGGDCLNTGCVPSKALIRAANAAHEIRSASQLGISAGPVSVDFSAVMDRIHAVIKDIEPHDSISRYTALGVDCIKGEARLISPWEVDIGGQRLSAKSIVIATGAGPFIPPVPGLEKINYLTSDNLWSLRQLPEKFLIMGGGPIGCELAQAFQRLGSQVTLVEMAPELLPREDSDVSKLITDQLQKEGVQIFSNHQVIGFVQSTDSTIAQLRTEQQTLELAFDKVLVAVGRKATTTELGLDTLGVETRDNGTIVVDDYLRTHFHNVFACGDVAGPYQFTHVAAHQAWYAAVNSLFGGIKKFKVDYSVIPWAIFTDPEIARVGLSEAEAKERGIAYELTHYDLSDLDRAIADNSAQGFVKVLTSPGKDKILGATIVGPHASELLTEFVTAMKRNLGLNKILGTIHSYPTFSEANKFAAGNWKRAHAPEKLLRWVSKYHYFLRR